MINFTIGRRWKAVMMRIWPSWRGFWELSLIIGFTCLFWFYGRRLHGAYPTSYTWSELLIDYQGGFVRRGLLGEIAFDARDIVSPASLLTGLVVAAYILCSVVLVRLSRRADGYPAFCFLLSPAGLLFPIYDQEAFGRKDIFIVASMLIAATLSVKRRGPGAFAAILLTYVVAGFIVETAWLYLPLSVALFAGTAGRDRPPRWHAAVWSATAATLASCFALVLLKSHALHDPSSAAAQRDAVVASWTQMAPGATLDLGALGYLGLSPAEGVAMALRGQGARFTALGYAAAFLFANMPALSHVLRSRPPLAKPGCAAWGAFAAMSATFLVGADWGRYIHLWMLHAFVFALLTRDRVAAGQAIRRADMLAIVMAASLYGSTWRIKHYAWNGDSAFVPGALFLVLRAAPR